MLSVTNSVIEKEIRQRIAKTWLSGGKSDFTRKSILMALPYDYLKQYNLDKPTNVLVIPTSEGLLIKKLEIKE